MRKSDIVKFHSAKLKRNDQQKKERFPLKSNLYQHKSFVWSLESK